MKTAVETAKVEMEKMGGLWCYSEHQTDLNGADDPNRAVAVIKSLSYDEKNSVVKLDCIEFLSDSDGAKRIIETAKTGKKYCVKRSVCEGRGFYALFGAV